MCIYIYLYVSMHVHTCASCVCECIYVTANMEVRGQLPEIVSLLLPHGFWGLNLGHQAWHEALLTEPSRWIPYLIFIQTLSFSSRYPFLIYQFTRFSLHSFYQPAQPWLLWLSKVEIC